MNFYFKRAFFGFLSLIIFWTLFLTVNQALAATSTPTNYGNYGLDDTVGQGNVGSALSVSSVGSNPGQFISSRVGQIIGAILSFIGVILLLLVIYAGILWMTSNGNEKNVDKAKDIITSAIIGLIIVLSAYAITAFVGKQLTGAPAPTGTSTASST